MTRSTRTPRVLQSFRKPRQTTNPYLRLLLAALEEEGLEVSTFTWPRALFSRYDVLHLHWPEVLLRGTTRPRTLARQLLFAVLLLRVRAGRTAVVRTVHNPTPHEASSRVESLLLAACDRATSLGVHLTPTTQHAWRTGVPGVVVPHGHYRDWYRPRTDVAQVSGRVLHFGILRPYKNVDELLDAVRAAPSCLSLRVVGSATTAALGERVRAAAAHDQRISADLRHVPDDELVAEVAAAELVVLPYATLHNSGAALMALSLDRPVLVPRNEVTDHLRQEVGPGWVVTYEPPLQPHHLTEALGEVRAAARRRRPDLGARGWSAAGHAHHEAYLSALAVADHRVRRRHREVARAPQRRTSPTARSADG